MYQTKLLSAVMMTLQSATSPLSIAEISSILEKKNITPNKTSLYRLLEKLKQNEQVSSLQIAEGMTHYELKNEPHGHFICQKCTDITCMKAPINSDWVRQITEEIPSGSLFGISLTMQGLCTKCTI
jgi:Fe2+ or Zn2+ uptake regulation protein